jgi:hypothetical protein
MSTIIINIIYYIYRHFLTYYYKLIELIIQIFHNTILKYNNYTNNYNNTNNIIIIIIIILIIILIINSFLR